MNEDERLLREVVRAWEALPGGQWSPQTVEIWLRTEMKPVIDALRWHLFEKPEKGNEAPDL